MNNTPIVPIIYYFLGNPFFLKEFKADVNKKGGIFSQHFHFFASTVCNIIVAVDVKKVFVGKHTAFLKYLYLYKLTSNDLIFKI